MLIDWASSWECTNRKQWKALICSGERFQPDWKGQGSADHCLLHTAVGHFNPQGHAWTQYLVPEGVLRNDVHHDHVFCRRLETRYTDGALWKHSPKTKAQSQMVKCVCWDWVSSKTEVWAYITVVKIWQDVCGIKGIHLLPSKLCYDHLRSGLVESLPEVRVF